MIKIWKKTRKTALNRFEIVENNDFLDKTNFEQFKADSGFIVYLF